MEMPVYKRMMRVSASLDDAGRWSDRADSTVRSELLFWYSFMLCAVKDSLLYAYPNYKDPMEKGIGAMKRYERTRTQRKMDLRSQLREDARTFLMSDEAAGIWEYFCIGRYRILKENLIELWDKLDSIEEPERYENAQEIIREIGSYEARN